MRWNVRWPLPQSRTGRVKPTSVLWYGIALLALTTLYYLTGRLGLSLAAVSGFATLVWLPTGLSVAALFLWGLRLWPAVTLGAFLVNFFTGAPWFVAVGIAIGNTLEVVVSTALLKRAGVRPQLDSLHDVLVLVLQAAPLGTIISPTLGVGSLWLGMVIAWPSVLKTWIAWWLGDMISLLLFTPVLLIWSQWPLAMPSRQRLIELSLLCTLVIVIGLFVFLRLLHPSLQEYPITYLVFPPLIWAALRFGQRAVASCLAILSCFALMGSIEGASHLSADSLLLRLFFLQTFMGITAATTLILAAVMAERRAFEQRKDAFIGMASHELRTPLTVLKGYTQLLQRQLARTEEHPQALHALARMETQTQQLARLIDDLLDLSKIQTGKLTFMDEKVDVDALVREVVEQFQPANNRYQICIEGSAQGTLISDRERLGQVLNNLLSNAVKYSPQAERIIVHLSSTAEYLTVSVQDFGIGIPAKEQEKVFQRYYRVLGSHGPSAPGLGIGLSIAREVIEHYEGQLWVKSVEGQGSTFSFSLPWQLSSQRSISSPHT